jgi:hypothetical protein
MVAISLDEIMLPTEQYQQISYYFWLQTVSRDKTEE